MTWPAKGEIDRTGQVDFTDQVAQQIKDLHLAAKMVRRYQKSLPKWQYRLR